MLFKKLLLCDTARMFFFYHKDKVKVEHDRDLQLVDFHVWKHLSEGRVDLVVAGAKAGNLGRAHGTQNLEVP